MMKSPYPPNVIAESDPGYMDLDHHEKRLQEALLLMETGQINKARLLIMGVLGQVRYYTMRRRIIREQQLASR